MFGIKKHCNNVYVIDIGNYKISLSAFLTLLVGFIVSIFIVVYIPNSIVASFFILLPTIIIAYEINCVEVGKCDTLALLLTTIYLVFSGMLLYLIFKHKNDPIQLKIEINKWLNKVGLDIK
jgi:hypothetical protein